MLRCEREQRTQSAHARAPSSFHRHFALCLLGSVTLACHGTLTAPVSGAKMPDSKPPLMISCAGMRNGTAEVGVLHYAGPAKPWWKNPMQVRDSLTHLSQSCNPVGSKTCSTALMPVPLWLSSVANAYSPREQVPAPMVPLSKSSVKAWRHQCPETPITDRGAKGVTRGGRRPKKSCESWGPVWNKALWG